MLGDRGAVTDTSDALWAAILAAPDEDGPRLVYGDLLLARGDPQGELIQIQCSNSPDSALRRREAELVADRGRWLGKLAPFATRYAMRRGFLDELGLEGRRVQAARLPGLLADRRIALLASLSIAEGGLGVAGARALAAAIAGPLARLRALSIDRDVIGDEGAAALSPAAAHLTALRLTEAGIGDAGARALAEGDPTALRELDLGENAIGAAGAAALAGSPRLARVTRLDLANNPIGAEGALRVAQGLALPELRELDASWCRLGPAAAALGTARCLEGVTKLDLSGNAIGGAAFAELLASPYLGRLEELSIGDNELHDASLLALCARADALPALAKLRLENNPITDAGLHALCESRLAPRLRRVGIWGGHLLSPEGKARYVRTFGKWRADGWPDA
jgi:uncharacterized protein (TIGR02996 family)